MITIRDIRWRVRVIGINYRLSRTFGNGRLQSAWKTVGEFFGFGAYLSPKYWRWAA